jgi:beta-N-acetylhexosaminidase
MHISTLKNVNNLAKYLLAKSLDCRDQFPQGFCVVFTPIGTMKKSKNIRLVIATLLSSVAFITAFALHAEPKMNELPHYDPPFLNADSAWVDSVFQSMTIEERIGQLLMVAAYSNKGIEHQKEIEDLIVNHGIGGLIFMQGGPLRQARLNNIYQQKAKVPLMMSIDGEWGLAMRLDSTERFPRQMLLGAIQNDSLIYDMGKEIGRQCKRIGVHVNFAPVVDVNVNPKNPVINSRSFGENKYRVASKGVAYMKGLQDVGIIANAKHFPGHGDTDTDSHKSLPIVNHSYERIDSVELYPFKELIRNGASSMMVAHLYIPNLDSTPNRASTLSPKIVNGLLKDSLGFKGLIFTDALNMKGVSKYYKKGDVDKLAFMAGNDILLFSGDVPKAISKIKEAIEKGEIKEEELNDRCRKVLLAKHWLGLADKSPQVDLENLYEDLNHPAAKAVNHNLVKHSITVLKNDSNLLPLSHNRNRRTASLVIGNKHVNEFQEKLSFYENITHFNLGKSPSGEQVINTLAALDTFDLVIIGISGTNRRPYQNFGISAETSKLIAQVNKSSQTILCFFANPYVLDKYNESFASSNALICAYEDTPLAKSYSAQAIFGGIGVNGQLPVSAGQFKEGFGLTLEKKKLGFGNAHNLGFDTEHLSYIDSIVLKGLASKAYPGCQLLIARKGEIIFDKNYGHHTYEKKSKVKSDDLYDLASVTKIAASVSSLMHLVDQGKVSLDSTLGVYLDYVDSTEYADLVIRDILAHQARLVSWIPFYKKTLEKGQLKYDLYSPVQSEEYPIQVANKLYIMKSYPDSIRKQIINHPLHKKKDYRYSDLGYYFMKDIIERTTGSSIKHLVDSLFFEPLGALTTTYHPLEKYNKSRIIPTEYDLIFRKQLIQGFVHDPGAAMLGGVGGHAGLFSSAKDLSKLMQMYLDMGEYNGQRFIDTAIVGEFTRCQFCANDNRRGVGFDKPATAEGGPTCKCISYTSFGHSGFTGTYAWADPEEEIIYIFLSNRVYPDANNKKLIRMNIRTDIMQVIYDALTPESRNSLH